MPDEDDGSPTYQRLYRTLIVLVASYLPVVGILGFLGYVFLHSLVPLYVLGGLYLLAFVIFGWQAYRSRPR